MKSERPREIFCPLLKRKLDEQLCADAAFVAEDFHPERFVPEEIRTVPNWKDVCRDCENSPLN